MSSKFIRRGGTTVFVGLTPRVHQTVVPPRRINFDDTARCALLNPLITVTQSAAMLRDRPLMCLFIAATVVVDLVALSVPSLQTVGKGAWLIGFVLGQLASLAHWAVNGRLHRLARGAWLVVAVGMLVFLLLGVGSAGLTELPTFVFLYVFYLVLTAILVNLLRFFTRRHKGDSSPGRWQISLVEMFGWTILVAIVSFGGRSMDVTTFVQSRVLWFFFAMLVIPSCFTLFVKKDLRDLNVLTGSMIVASICGTVYFFARMSSPAVWAVVVIQAAYLICWLLVRGFDNVMCEARAVSEAAAEELADGKVTE